MEALEKALVEQKPKKTYITIEPYFDPNVFNMGLEKYGEVLINGTGQIEDLGYMTIAGVHRYKTGLDEFANEVKALPPHEREAKVKEIRTVVSRIELELAQNSIDVEDKDFWSKVILCKPDNHEFWGKINLRVEAVAKPLDPEDINDLIRIYAIEAGGFTLVAPSLEALKKSSKPCKFYLSRLEDTSAIRTEIKKLRNKAGGELDKLRVSKQNRLFLIAKLFLSSENCFTRNTPLDLLYDKIDDILDGVGVKDKKKQNISEFISLCGKENKELLLRAYVKDAIFYRILFLKSDKYYYTQAGSTVGKTLEECYTFFSNPLNEKELEDLIERVEERWNK